MFRWLKAAVIICSHDVTEINKKNRMIFSTLILFPNISDERL